MKKLLSGLVLASFVFTGLGCGEAAKPTTAGTVKSTASTETKAPGSTEKKEEKKEEKKD